MTLQGQSGMMTSPDRSGKVAVVLYHDNCCDGFGAAWAWKQLMESKYSRTHYVPVSYGDNPFLENVAFVDRDVYILDFSFPRNYLIALSEFAHRVILIDHHKTAKEDLLDWKECPKNLEIYFDMEHSGAMLTWLVLAPTGSKVPQLLEYIEDRDLWKHKLPDTKEINAVVANTAKNFIAYSELSNSLDVDYAGVATIGEHLLASHQRICQEIVKDSRPCSIETESGTYHGLACNCTPQFASDVGNILANNSGTFGATYHTTGKGNVKWSLRSNGDYDVSAIAKAYGGGGHKNAAGFSLEQNGGSQQDAIAIWKIPGKGESE